MSLAELTVLLIFYAIILGIFVISVYWFTIHPSSTLVFAETQKRPALNPAEIELGLKDVTPPARPVTQTNARLSARMREIDRHTELVVPNDTIDAQRQELPPAAPVETLPTFHEVWSARSNTTAFERTSYVKELQANALIPVSLPLEKIHLPEGLRTLEVSPNRTIEPGMVVHAAFTFRNLGGAAATGFRVRFGLPVELAYVPGSARIDGVPLEDRDGQTPFAQQLGAEIGDIPAGGERRLGLAYRVADVIEDGSQVTIQAAVASPKVPVIGTNIVRLTVRSFPQLENTQTSLSLTAVKDAVPGAELRINARLHNSGQSTAHEVVALLPVPEHTTFVPQSATVGGRLFTPQTQGQTFGSARRIVVAETLEPGETVDMGYRVRIDSPLEDGTIISADGSVCSQEVGQFALPAAALAISSAAAFDDAETTVRLESADEVKPGDHIRITACAKNVGTAVARDFSFAISLPDGLSYIPGSLTIDGVSTVDHDIASGAVRLADLAPGETVRLALTANVKSPITDGRELRVLSTIAWSNGKREFERTVTARSAARFPLSFNKLERETPQRVLPSSVLSYKLTLHNTGTDSATQVQLEFTAAGGIEHLRFRERDNELELLSEGAVQLGTIKPGMSRSFRIDGRVAAVIEDQTELHLSAALLTAQTTRVELGPVINVVDSAPAFSIATSNIVVDSDEPLRYRGLVRARLVLKNEGTDRGRAVRVTLLLPPELKLELVKGEAADGEAVNFGDIPAGETREVEVCLRLIGSMGDRLHIGARLSATNLMPVNLTAIDLDTHAEPSFEETTLSTVPLASIDAGGEIIYTLSMRNSGNGTAHRLNARVTSLTDAVYAHGSTTVNGIALQDHAGTSLLFSSEGLTLADVAAGVEAVVRWRAIVNTPLSPSNVIQSIVSVKWDDAPEVFVSAKPLRVLSTAALPVAEPSLPFSILGAVAAPKVLPADASQVPQPALVRRAS